MVSLRRRKLLALCAGRGSFIAPLPRSFNGTAAANPTHNSNPVRVHPGPSVDVNQLLGNKLGPKSSNESGSSSSKEQPIQPEAGPPIKRRKRHRRKNFQNQEPCPMRGVYFKNLKWQAAIKVDKKQIHLGTVGSQEEAARLYDSSCPPSFHLSDGDGWLFCKAGMGGGMALRDPVQAGPGGGEGCHPPAGLLSCVGGNPTLSFLRRRRKNLGNSSGKSSWPLPVMQLLVKNIKEGLEQGLRGDPSPQWRTVNGMPSKKSIAFQLQKMWSLTYLPLENYEKRLG
ncbi:ethylene-responsive transcription factor-like protein At4g13040 isoform X1 [Carya illinoinensis]|uniref:ethylene-responsive transcription factor-like protein At4g13040 isoform X1 n=1 Tax=Carya illinoinensis TaxID=32201 RepID=UPI001C722550|nr:ethylene-responsive transcription factor-like protein At4g13040 isoform X1 [Carya illinoinensis]XP_042963819.1 ethylene-responsive transcription factor-like protein At4g13040 isoform X1 [Carya illinoinensis]